MKRFTSKTQKTGELGEKICIQYLEKENFKILDQNYTKKCGEIDIIAEKNKTLHFIEVKSSKIRKNVTHETYNPAENLTKSKLSKIHRTISVYLEEQKVSHETLWQIDVYCVYISENEKDNKIIKIENII